MTRFEQRNVKSMTKFIILGLSALLWPERVDRLGLGLGFGQVYIVVIIISLQQKRDRR